MNNRLRNFTQSMIDLVYWYHEPLLEAYKKIEQLENRNHELRKELEAVLSKLAAAEHNVKPTSDGLGDFACHESDNQCECGRVGRPCKT